jgi:hypothetical protein
VLIAVGCVTMLSGCVSMASGGPVLPYKVTQSNAPGQQYLQVTSAPPAPGANPVQIVQGFLDANASFDNNHQVAREYLTSAAAVTWLPKSAMVFSGAPTITVVCGGGKHARTALVKVSGKIQTSVTTGSAPASPPAHGQLSDKITLERSPGGEWRIAKPPTVLLLSVVDFSADYQSRNLYFFNPSRSALVPDPVPVETARTDPDTLLGGLVQDLLPQNQPQAAMGWLNFPATQTAFPDGSTLIGVSLAGGTANVNLGGSVASAGNGVLEQVSAQLLWTLIGSGGTPAVQSVAVYLNGKAWSPPGAGNDPVQQTSQYPRYQPATGSQSDLYYLDSMGNVLRRTSPTGKAIRVFTWTRGQPRLTSIAVSPDQKYLAGLSSDGTVYTGRIGGPLRSRVSVGYSSMSWDDSDNLWAAGPSEIALVHGANGSTQIVNPPTPQIITAMRVAPDGVRVAFVINGSQVAFGAIVPARAPAPPGIVLSQFSVTGTDITDLSWYGADDVIALSSEGLTEYPVNGSASIPITRLAGMVNVTASWNNPLIAGLRGGEMSYNPSLNGGWVSLGETGSAPVYPG